MIQATIVYFIVWLVTMLIIDNSGSQLPLFTRIIIGFMWPFYWLFVLLVYIFMWKETNK